MFFGDDKRNLIIAIVAVVVILIGWQFLVPPVAPPPPSPEPVAETADGQGAVATPGKAGPATPDRPIDRDEAIATSSRIDVDAPRFSGSIALTGARIDDSTLHGYRETVEEGSPEIVLLSPRNTANPYFSEFGWISSDSQIKLPSRDTVWQTNQTVIRLDQPATLTWDNGEGLFFTRTISVDEQFLYTVTQRVENRTNASVELYPYGFIAHFGTPPSTLYKPWGVFQQGALGALGENMVEHGFDDMQDAPRGKIEEPAALGGWLGVTSKFWLTALVPDQTRSFVSTFKHQSLEQAPFDRYQVDYRYEQPLIVNPGGVATATNHLFAGAKEVGVLDDYEESLGIERFDLAVDFGFAWFLAKPMFYAVDFFNRVTGNFGIAILLLTICVRIVLFPLANKAYASMSRMRKLQPEMIMLRERYKDDKPRMNTELMALYRNQKANPIAGCLPILVQIPVFFALYSVLFVTIEMRHAPFFGWIQDLSVPDPLTFITAFGYLNWPVPDFLLVGLWPIAFAVTMYLQMKLNPQPVEPIQQKIMMALPFVFLFLFARFPAGLVVYWTWNNVLSIGQQWLIMRRMGVTRKTLAEDAEKIKKIKADAEKGILARPSGSRKKKKKKSDGDGESKRPAGSKSTSAKTGKASSAKSDKSTPKKKRKRAPKPEVRTPTKRESALEAARARAMEKRKARAAAQREKARKKAAAKAGPPEPPAEPKKSRRERRAERQAAQSKSTGDDSQAD